MKFIEALQGSPEWLQARAGAITASTFADAISVLKRTSGEKRVGDPTDASDKLAGDIAIERITNKPYGAPPKAWVLERGHIMEARGRIAYESRTGLMAQEAGVCKTDDNWFGYSTDGLVDDDGLIEIKCPVDTIKIATMFKTGDVSEYIHQMQGGMWITGRQWCDFIMYVPDLESVSNDLYVKRIYRDDNFIDEMVEKLMKFRGSVQMRQSLFSKPFSSNADQLKQAA